MFALLFAVALPTILLSPGTYTLTELSGELKKQGVELIVKADCADECYALSLKGISAAGLADALRATGRLEVTGNGGRWEVKRSPADREADRMALNRHLLAVLTPAATTRSAAIRQFVSLLALPPDRASVEVRANDRAARANGDPAMIEAATLAQQLVDRQALYAQVAIPTFLPTLGRGALDPVRRLRMADRPDWFFPHGYRERVLPFDAPSLAFGGAPDIAGVKVGWDPISGTAALRVSLGYSADEGLCLTYGAAILRSPALGPPPPEAVLTREELGAYRRRTEATERVFAESPPEKPVDGSRELRRLSNALLRAASEAAQNLVAYVSPLSDRVLAVDKDATLRSLVKKAVRGEFDPKADSLTISERTGYDAQPVESESSWRPISVVAVGATLVVRNETDYLDGIVVGPPTLPKILRDARLAKKTVRAAAVLEHVASLGVSGWTGAIFGSGYLDYTNPLALYPFAAMAMGSPKFMTVVESVAPGSQGQIPLSSIEATARKAFLTAIAVAGDRVDRAEKSFEPMEVVDLAHRGRLANSTIRVVKRENGCRFELVSGMNSAVLWAAWLDNVSFGQPR